MKNIEVWNNLIYGCIQGIEEKAQMAFPLSLSLSLSVNSCDCRFHFFWSIGLSVFLKMIFSIQKG